MTTPAISVLMPVYNAELYVEKAIRSVLRQSFSDFELVVVNDGSTDRSVAVIEKIQDARVRLVHNESNQGLARVRNRLLELARAPLIAWLDSDDYSLPGRLKTQSEYLRKNPETVLCGGFVRPFESESGRFGKVWRYPIDPDGARVRLLFDDPFATSTVMARASVFRERGIEFRLDYPPAEDYDVWERVARYGRVANLGRVLTCYRIHGQQSSTAGKEREVRSVRAIQGRQLDAFGIEASEAERDLHLSFGLNRYRLDEDYLRASEVWLRRLLDHNERTGFYPREAFRAVAADRWFRICYAGWRDGLRSYSRYRESPLAHIARPEPARRLGFLMRNVASYFLPARPAVVA